MHLGDGQHAAMRLHQRVGDFGARAARLKLQQGRDELKAVADAVTDLAQQHRALLGQRLVAVPRRRRFRLRGFLGAAQIGGLNARFDVGPQQREELAANVLDHIIGRARLQRGDGGLAVLGAGEIDDRRRIGQFLDCDEDAQPFLIGKVMVQDHGVDAAGGDPLQAARAVDGDFGSEAMPLQILFDKVAKRFIVVDEQDVDASVLHHEVSGT